MNYKISIIIPTYNRANYVVQTIQSVIEQNFENFELIVVDDGSTDETKDAIAPFINEKVIYHYQSNQGRSVARNNGSKIARGEWLMFLDSDDLLTPIALETLYNYSSEFAEAQMIVGKLDLIDSENNHLDNLDSKYNVKISRGLLKKPYIQVIPGMTHQPGTYIVRKDVVLNNGGFDSSFHASEDFDFSLKVAFECNIFDIAETIALIRRHEGNSTIDNQRLAAIKVAEKHLKEFVPNLPEELRNTAISKFYLHLGDIHYELDKHKIALNYYLSAVRCNFSLSYKSNICRQIIASMLPSSIKRKIKSS